MFDRPSGGRLGHIPALDGLRGLAILLVLMQHLGGGRHSDILIVRVIADSMRLGWTGVSLFFVLSGFLISGIVWDSSSQPNWWLGFYIRRALRIFPLYYAALAYAAVSGFLFEPEVLHRLWVYVFYLQNVGPLVRVAELLPGDRVVLDPFWSLAVEEQFYLVWPFLLALLAPRRTVAMRVCLAVWIGSFALRLGMAHSHLQESWLYRFSPSRVGELCLGAFLALCIRSNPQSVSRLLRLSRPVFLLSAAVLVALGISTSGNFETYNTAWTTLGIFILPVLFSSMIALCLEPSAVQRFFSLPILRWFGRISYGIYVYHLLFRPIYHWLALRLLPHSSMMMTDLLTSVISIASTLVVATISFHFLESPFLRMKKRLRVLSQPPERTLSCPIAYEDLRDESAST
jgi:peptidoglycan/LPS O-acetylase OafA/YrhL